MTIAVYWDVKHQNKKTKYQVSVYRTIGPLVYNISESFELVRRQILEYKRKLIKFLRIFPNLQYLLSKNKKDVTIFHLKITIFRAVKKHSILNRHVIIMAELWSPSECVHGLNY